MLPALRSRLVGGCEVGRVDCGVAGHGRLTALVVPPGMRWPVPAGPLGLVVFFGEGRLRGPYGDRELVEDDLVLCRAAGPVALEASGEEELRAYLWEWEATAELPGYERAAPRSARWAAAEPAPSPPVAGSAVVDGGAGVVRVGTRTVTVAAGDVLHHGGAPVRPVDGAGLALIGVWAGADGPVLGRRALG